jgi:hypothetical protein
MQIRSLVRHACLVLVLSSSVAPARAQIVETAGGRAPGMGGAFVAVADDSSATWWNPAGLAAGPFLDLGVTRTPNATSFAIGTPPFGVSYYSYDVTNIRRNNTTASDEASRQVGRAGIAEVEASQLGVTLLQTLLPGIHVGTTVKYVRGGADEGETTHHADLDVGALAVTGAVRLGLVARNLTEPELADGAYVLPRQVRVGAAFDAAQVAGPPLLVAIDADLRTYWDGSGERRVVAVGAEHWLFERRLGIRAGARFNTAGDEARTGTAGLTVSPRAGLFIDGFVARGGTADEEGWGLAARVSF